MPSLPAGVYDNCGTCNRYTTDAGDKGSSLSSLHADADGVGFSGNARVTDIDIVIAYCEIASSISA